MSHANCNVQGSPYASEPMPKQLAFDECLMQNAIPKARPTGYRNVCVKGGEWQSDDCSHHFGGYSTLFGPGRRLPEGFRTLRKYCNIAPNMARNMAPNMAPNMSSRETSGNLSGIFWGPGTHVQPPLTSPHLNSFHLTSPRLTSPHLTSHLRTSHHIPCGRFRSVAVEPDRPRGRRWPIWCT